MDIRTILTLKSLHSNCTPASSQRLRHAVTFPFPPFLLRHLIPLPPRRRHRIRRAYTRRSLQWWSGLPHCSSTWRGCDQGGCCTRGHQARGCERSNATLSTCPSFNTIHSIQLHHHTPLTPSLLLSQVIMGNVVSAGIGQAPARQASKFAGLPDKTVCNTINKVGCEGAWSWLLWLWLLLGWVWWWWW